MKLGKKKKTDFCRTRKTVSVVRAVGNVYVEFKFTFTNAFKGDRHAKNKLVYCIILA